MSDSIRDWPDRLRIDPTAFIAPGAVVVGDVTLGARSSIWFNTVVRGDGAAISIGDDTNIQDNSTVHIDEGFPAIVGARVTVGHRAIVHGCVVEDDVLIGMGAVVLTGARIGSGSLIGASALVKEHQVIPPGSLVLGAPARVVGPVSDAHRAAIATGAHHYAELARSFMERGISSALPPTAHRNHPMPRAGEAMDWLEWEQRLEVLRAGPRLGQELFEDHGDAAFRRRPADGGWTATEIVCHLRDCDRDVFLPRVERALAEAMPAVPDVHAHDWARERGYADVAPEAALAGWRAERERLLACLEPLGPEAWCRPLVHPVRGPHRIADVLRYATDHELAHRRQLRRALGARG
jgi:carbonic anhydrase/acetyltransferase-like protein (isoleucine patch superfamily)